MDQSRCFNVTFDCNSSKHIYPSNSVANFRLRLPRTLHLNDSWRVGLADVTYTNARYTFDRPQTVVVRSVDDKLKVNIGVKASVYDTVEELIEEINKSIKRTMQIEKKPRLKLINNRVTAIAGYYMAFGRMVEVSVAGYSDTLHTILGVDRWGIPQLNARVPLLFVYCSIVKQTVVGDVEAKLLRMINTGYKQSYSATVSHVFRRIYYSHIDTHDIDEIEIQLLDDTGKVPLFKNGSFRVTLQFRQQHGPVHDSRL